VTRQFPHISVVICTHNPRPESFRRVNAALAAQSLPRESWELIIVDNCSNPPLREQRAALGIPADAVVLTEGELGLTPARLAGIGVARAEVIVFVDDDNVLAPDYLSVAAEIMAAEPRLGAVGGVIHAEYEEQPRKAVSGSLWLLGIRDFGCRPIRALIYDQVGPWEPIGAGMVIRADVAHRYRQAASNGTRRSLDRRGASLGSCGDTDMARCAPDLGFYLGYEPRLSLVHLIPKFRVKPRYLVRLHRALARTGTILDRIRTDSPGPLTSASARLWYWISALRRVPSLSVFRTAARFADAWGRYEARKTRLDAGNGN
jgi:glycosyltransferase involved in cell wall biosynthesis